MIRKLQLMQKAAICLLTGARLSDHVIPILLVCFHVQFEVLLNLSSFIQAEA